MIRNSFMLLEGLGEKGEQGIWKQGIKDWDAFLGAGSIRGISAQRKYYYERKLKEARRALDKDDSSYFVGRLPPREMWRLYGHFRDECGFLDIEIDWYGRTVLVGISDFYSSNFFVRGVNLEKDALMRELSKYKVLVTFNGGAFDLPKLRKQFGLAITIPHLDLKPLCTRLGWTGGLKEVEKKLGVKRPQHLYGNPVELWRAFQASGEREWLDLLIEYNREDVENLKVVMEKAFRLLRQLA